METRSDKIAWNIPKLYHKGKHNKAKAKFQKLSLLQRRNAGYWLEMYGVTLDA